MATAKEILELALAENLVDFRSAVRKNVEEKANTNLLRLREQMAGKIGLVTETTVIDDMLDIAASGQDSSLHFDNGDVMPISAAEAQAFLDAFDVFKDPATRGQLIRMAQMSATSFSQMLDTFNQIGGASTVEEAVQLTEGFLATLGN